MYIKEQVETAVSILWLLYLSSLQKSQIKLVYFINIILFKTNIVDTRKYFRIKHYTVITHQAVTKTHDIYCSYKVKRMCALILQWKYSLQKALTTTVLVYISSGGFF